MKKLLLLIFYIGTALFLHAQSIEIAWESGARNKISFKGAIYENGPNDIPVFKKKIVIAKGYRIKSVKLFDKTFDVIPD